MIRRTRASEVLEAELGVTAENAASTKVTNAKREFIEKILELADQNSQRNHGAIRIVSRPTPETSETPLPDG